LLLINEEFHKSMRQKLVLSSEIAMDGDREACLSAIAQLRASLTVSSKKAAPTKQDTTLIQYTTT
jgi:hypothetical protein